VDNQIVAVLDTHPVLINTIESGYSLANDWSEGEEEMRRILDTHPVPLFIIDDIREMKISFDDLITGASLGSRGKDPIWQHPNARGMYFISDSKLVAMAAAGLNNPVFGNMLVKVFRTLEEALAHIEQVMAN
jgi:hypothetical protein